MLGNLREAAIGSREKTVRIGLCAPGTRLAEETARRAVALAGEIYGERVELWFHPQCFQSAGHFAGDDETRTRALLDIANDPQFDALWFARGGYGACRIAPGLIARLNEAASAKKYLGYSDIGFLLGGLYRAGVGRLAHGPMPVDLGRAGGEAAFRRGLAWLVEDAVWGLEAGTTPGHANVAFNLTILSQLLGTPLEPVLDGHVIQIEDIGEYMYRLDRYFFHVTSNVNVQRCAGIRLGRCSAIPKNDPDFGMTEEEVARHWCERSGIAYLGRADIGHDIDNKIVPFG
ncbi:MAG: LD-carboxypeptidase [Alphaproteobacteria bacterium]|nr:LD-carboxypeptidase [Alphaproteobacteria bacterium]